MIDGERKDEITITAGSMGGKIQVRYVGQYYVVWEMRSSLGQT
jgi:hypothetical protein